MNNLERLQTHTWKNTLLSFGILLPVQNTCTRCGYVMSVSVVNSVLGILGGGLTGTSNLIPTCDDELARKMVDP